MPAACSDARRLLRPDRRSFLRAGVLGTAGLSLADLLRAEARPTARGRLPSVIILWMRGGPAQHETWDPKPDAPAEIRGPFKSIATDVPGNSELIAGRGLLAAPDPAALAEAIDAVAAEPGLRAELARRCAQAAHDYSWDAVADRVERIYDEVYR